MKQSPIYLPGLNGLRAIAALSVVIAHVGLEGVADFGLPYVPNLPLAGYGVTLFFVISGFLITFLLLREIDITNKIDVKKFYLRRILRIWPIYYLFILVSVIVLFLDGSLQKILVPDLWYYIFFAANIPFIFQQGILIIVHYWSIGVEEQFYLFWPWLVRFSKRKIILVAVSLFILFFLFKIISWYFYGTESYIYRFFLIVRFHCMMLGAVGAFLFVNNKSLVNIFTHKLTQVVSWIVFLFMGFGIIHIPALISQEVVAFLSLSLILSQVSGTSWLINIENRFFDYVGKISYGIYVIHPLVILILSHTLKDINSGVFIKYILVYSSVISCTVILASISYFYFESPFLKMKNKFAIVKSTNTMINK